MLTDKIKDLCQQHFTSIPRIEEKLGFGAGTISHWKKSSPSFDNIIKVAELFHVSLDWLAERKNAVEMENNYTSDELKLLYYYRRLNDDGKKNAIHIMDGLTSVPAYTKTKKESHISA